MWLLGFALFVAGMVALIIGFGLFHDIAEHKFETWFDKTKARIDKKWGPKV